MHDNVSRYVAKVFVKVIILRRPRSFAVPSLPSLSRRETEESEGTANDLGRLTIRLHLLQHVYPTFFETLDMRISHGFLFFPVMLIFVFLQMGNTWINMISGGL